MWYYSNNELYHYGVLGMKWGRRRFQNEDGSLTRAGKNRYDPNVENAKTVLKVSKNSYDKAYQNYNKATLGGLTYDQKATKDLTNASNEVDFAKKELSDAKIRSKMAAKTKKSGRQEMFEQKYKEHGMTQNEAELAAYKRIRTERVIAVTAGLTIAAATAYVAYKYHDNNIDKIIKSGTQLQNISMDSNKGVKDAFYASKNKLDNAKYRGIYGNQLKSGLLGELNNTVYETKIAVNENLKVASKKSSINALTELVKSNKSYAKALETQLNETSGQFGKPKQNKVIEDALRSLKSGKVNSKVYEALNLSLVDHSPIGQTTSKGLYDFLKDKGYDAIKDINDSNYSGYKSANPLIVFNGAAKSTVSNIRELGKKEIQKNMLIGYADIVGKDIVKMGTAYCGAVFGIKAVSDAARSKSNTKIVSDYRMEHPESTLSYNEIVRNHNQ